MIRNIVHDVIFLGRKSEAATMTGKFLAVCMEVWLGYDLIHFNPHGLIVAGIMVCLLAAGLFGSRLWQKKDEK